MGLARPGGETGKRGLTEDRHIEWKAARLGDRIQRVVFAYRTIGEKVGYATQEAA
ncbi:MAG: hypothetical protein HY788_12385 [Deltaproteobacteria bacterium]|nr:hypothetical protein [Deltaproteobacteria bacterium]